MQVISLAQTGNGIHSDMLQNSDLESISPPNLEDIDGLMAAAEKKKRSPPSNEINTNGSTPSQTKELFDRKTSKRDWIAEALPIEPWFIGGPVIRGFGQCSKVLGIPTANLPTEAFSSISAQLVCGIYLGWAGLADRGVYKMVMSVGYNPYFRNAEKTVEPWLLHDFPEDFYDEELRLVVCGYIRPEADCPSLEALIERIHEDGRAAEKALGSSPYREYGLVPHLTTPLQSSQL